MRIACPIILLCYIAPTSFFAQTESPTAEDLLENFYKNTDQPGETDAVQVQEDLDFLRDHPLDLNRADREDLSELRILQPVQIENLLAYRDQFGPFLNQYELQAVPGLGIPDIRLLLTYAMVRTGTDTRYTPLLKGLYQGKNETLFRWGRPYPTPFDPTTVEGGPNAFGFRYRHIFDNRLRYGVTAENDPGEAFFKRSNRNGFDFYSAHLFVQNVGNVIKTVALGDFSARFGQGLLLQTGFASGKTAETTMIARGGRKLNAYGSFGETYFLRGAACTLSPAPHFEITTLFSSRWRDGNLTAPDSTLVKDPAIGFTALETSGLHRTQAEISDKNSLKENIGGVNFNYENKHMQVGFNGLLVAYDKPLQPANAPYRIFSFRGKYLGAVSIDYVWRHRNWYYFGETARSDNGAIATVNGLLLTPDPHITLSAVHRLYPASYQSIYARPFAESAGASNEQGLYLGADIRWIRRLQLNVYADIWRFPWLRSGVGAPSSGSEWVGRVIWTKSKVFTAYALFQLHPKEQQAGGDSPGSLTAIMHKRLRLHTIYKVARAVELRSRLEWTRVEIPGMPDANGFIAYQEALIKPLGFPISGSVRYAIFDTDNYETRVYAFEDDLFAGVSIPAYSGRGARYYVNLNWRVSRRIRLEGRIDQTIQQTAVTGSGTTGVKTAVKLQMRVSF